MSGGAVPYHLRQNKTVDRGVFVDLLQRISRGSEVNISSYRYIGFAGPFSEDFKLLHAHLGIKRFKSIESDNNVLRRQKWNSPLRGIEFIECTAREFIESYEASQPTVLWLDYASPSQLADQLAEVEMLVSKSADYDVLKFTFNASPRALATDPAERVEEARNRLGAYWPAGMPITPDDVDRKGYPSLILKGVEFAIKQGMLGKAQSGFQLLTAFTYADSQHRMLTLTGIILPKGKKSLFFKKTGIQGWGLALTKWGASRTVPVEIMIPEMSLRERLCIDQQLPRRGTPKAIMRKLGFKLAEGGEQQTLKSLSSYKSFYRYFPYFSKMVV